VEENDEIHRAKAKVAKYQTSDLVLLAQLLAQNL